MWQLEANWLTVTLVMPLAMPLIAIAWADWEVPSLMLWGAYGIGVPVSAKVVQLLLHTRRQNLAVEIALAAYVIAWWAFMRHVSAWETLAPAGAALATATAVATLYRAP